VLIVKRTTDLSILSVKIGMQVNYFVLNYKKILLKLYRFYSDLHS